jgi:predicted acyltransferase
MTKPGYKTTEFAVTVLTSLAALIAAIADYLPPRYAALAASVVAAGYAIARGLAKQPPAVVTAPPTTVVPPPTP